MISIRHASSLDGRTELMPPTGPCPAGPFELTIAIGDIKALNLGVQAITQPGEA